MTSASVNPPRWSAGRWWTAIGVLFAFHVILVLWLGDRSPAASRKLSAAPTFRLSDSRTDEWLAIEDPTLFALPHRHGFSGEAWLRIQSQQFHPADWSEPARCLPLDDRQLGNCFMEFARTNIRNSFPVVAALKPDMSVFEPFPIAPPPPASRLRIEGALAARRLLSPLQLPTFTNTDLVTNSVVQLLVDARGNTLSAVLLPPGSVLNEPDLRALHLARSARFEPVDTGGRRSENPSAEVSIGTMIFEWQTVLISPSNAPPVSP